MDDKVWKIIFMSQLQVQADVQEFQYVLREVMKLQWQPPVYVFSSSTFSI